jgi:AraC-like DNA-binding protein
MRRIPNGPEFSFDGARQAFASRANRLPSRAMPGGSQPESAVLLLRALVESAAAAGVDVSRLLAGIGVAPAVLEDASGWVPASVMARAWRVASELSGDVAFGLHAAESTPPGAYGALEYATMSSASLVDALRRAVRYYGALGSLGDPTLVQRGGLVRIGLRPRSELSPGAARHFVEHFFGLLVTRGRLLTGGRMKLARATFVHPAPPSTAEHARVFGAPLEFGARANELVAERHSLSLPLRSANPELLEPLERTAATMLDRRAEDLVVRTRAVVPEVLRAGEPGLAAAARRLGVSARTLQRRLGEQGTSYAAIVDEVRRDLARREVALGKRSFVEIALLLGFSQASAFDRAFRRWTGSTPSAYRRSETR